MAQAMAEVVPRFFFSYSRADKDRYLDRFFQDLRKRVADVDGLAIELHDIDAEERFDEVGFRDRDGVKTGEDWKAKIGSAVQRNGVLVCLYSPNFFSQRKTKQFCAREFTAFLRRHPGREDAPGNGEIAETRHILPILWLNLQKLRKKGLPPDVLRRIQWDIEGAAGDPDREKLNNNYLKKGVRRITKSQGLTYEDILDHFAERIREVALKPLPPLDEPPDIESLPSAWMKPQGDGNDSPSSNATADTAAKPPTDGPTIIRVIEVQNSVDAGEWAPYGEDSISALFEEIANRRALADRTPLVLESFSLDPSAQDFTTRISKMLEAAIGKSVRPILVVDPRSLASDTMRAAIFGLLRKSWRAGLLVPASAEDQEAVRLIEQYREQLMPSADTGWLPRLAIGGPAEFRVAAISIAEDLLSRIVTTDTVQQSPPDNAGPAVRPRIANQAEDET